MTAAQIFSLLMALVCLLGLVRLALPTAKRRQFDQFFERKWVLTTSFFGKLWARQPEAPKQPTSEQAARAKQAAAAAIEQARRTARATEVSREGNVYRPEAFKGPRKRP